MTFRLTSDDKARLDRSKTFAEALGVLVDAAATLDELGEALGTTRFAIIGWRNGRWPRAYVEKLRKLGVPDRLLQPGAEIQKRLLRAEAELERVRELLR